MANEKWSVTTEQLITAAGEIRDLTGKYVTEYSKLYTELQALRSTHWQGIASDAFNQKLEGYRDTFIELEKVLNTYAEGLEKRAANYDQTENAAKEAAGNLR